MCVTITLHSLATASLWAVGIGLAMLDVIYPPHLGALAVGCMVGGMTLAIRGYIARYAADWESAYDAGREVTRLRRR